ncbi:MAG: hypothetical protein HY763_07450 [Planctomycetes bacterium]|nr:hypothetical protein [Planctomycetota bacterium]
MNRSKFHDYGCGQDARPRSMPARARRRRPSRLAVFSAAVILAWLTGGLPALAQPEKLRTASAALEADVLMRALVDELDRSMSDLRLEDLARPYFIQFTAEERNTHSISASYGGLLTIADKRTRGAGSRVRVGSMSLDNTNIGRGGPARGALPLDDDYTTIRHTLWRLTDEDYKRAVEAITRKQAYLRDKTIEDRPDDFSLAEPVQQVDPLPRLEFDTRAWSERLKHLSARFKEHPAIRESNVNLFAGSVAQYVVNSEGTRLRTGDTGIYLQVYAVIQADDGMILNDSLTFLGERPEQIPGDEKLLAEIDALARKLVALAQAPILEQYTGPVLFDASAAGRVFETLLADGLCARPTPLGAGANVTEETLEKKLGLRILPRSFQVYDDPRPRSFAGITLAGAYNFDDEGVPAARVSLVENGILKDLLSARAPTKKIKRSNGHGRGGDFGDPRATIACLYVSDQNAVSPAELKQELVQAAREEGLEFALRIESMEGGDGNRLGSPIHAYKVFVSDGREELVRGLEFLPVQTRALKRILAADNEPKAHNTVSPISLSVITPAILFEDLELRRLTEELDKPPILKSPAQRGGRMSSN